MDIKSVLLTASYGLYDSKPDLVGHDDLQLTLRFQFQSYGVSSSLKIIVCSV